MYENFTRVVERAIRHTDSGNAPWLLVEANDQRYRDLTVARTILDNLRQRCPMSETASSHSVPSTIPVEEVPPSSPAIITEIPKLISPKNARTILDMVDLTQHLSRKEYDKELETHQGKLHRLAWEANQKKCSTIIVFEGWDAAGKGGCIRRITQAMDARLYQTISIAAPTDEERAHHYLWRFWRNIPRAGRVTIYDRSWYGRVLVERVEGFAHEKEWKRAYLEINDFEEQLAHHGDILIKFWIHISPEEQLRRFKEREQIAYKRHKITPEDWRNRDKWEDYSVAINDMVARTSTDFAPWTLVAGNDKRFGRLQVLKTICNRLETALAQLN
jgi:polyphosphate:AMP phosphotransferase